MKKTNWKNIHRNFTPDLIQDWTSQGFTYEQTQDWINIGLTPQDAYYAAWLRDVKKTDSLWVPNYGDDESLRVEYQEYQLNRLKNLTVPTHDPKNKPFLTTNHLLILTGLILVSYYLLVKEPNQKEKITNYDL